MKVKVCVVDFELPSRVKKWAVRIGTPLLILSVTVVALAQPVTFTDGQTLTAAQLNTNVGYLVPSGAVVAFNLSACPTGWTVMAGAAGRTIIGVNPNPGGNGLSQRNLGDTVGEEMHTMAITELVAHSHTFGLEAPVDASFSNGTTDLQVTGGSQVESALGTSAPSNATGGGSPFNNMQPSLALLYCQKE